MDTTYQTGTNGQGNPSSVQIPNVQPIAPGSILGTQPANIPATEPAASLTPTLQSLSQSYQQQALDAQAQAAKAEEQKNSTANTLKNLQTQLGGQNVDQMNAEQTQGIPTMNKELSDLIAKGQQETAQYLNQVNALNQGGTGTIGGVSAGETAANRQHAIDAMFTNSLVQAKQGNIAFAQSMADKAIAAKYDPIKAEIAANQAFLDANYKDLSRADQKLADAQSAKNAIDLKQVEKDEQNQKAIQDTIVDAINGGAPNALVLKAQQAKSPAEASAILGKYSSAALDRKYKEAQIANVYSEISKRNAESGGTNFITPPMINPQTGKTDPVAQLTSVIDGTNTKDNAKLQDVLGVVAATQAPADGNPEGTFKGLSPLPRLTPGVFKSQEQVSNKGAIEAINLKVQQWASGAALTPAQTKQVGKLTPRKGDSDNEVKKKTNSLTNFMLTQAQGLLASQGIKYNPSTVDYYGDGIKSMSNKSLLDMIPSTSSGATNNQAFFDNFN